MLYNNLSTYLKQKYGKKIGKICIDGGFTCPNRDGKCGTGGCIFCGERGAGEHIDPSQGIREQAEAVLRRGAYDGYIAYFQSFTNTYAPTDTLRERYEAALCDNRILALAIGTRPDCIDEECAALIASFKDRVDVWVELGLQTASDETAKIINRGYNTSTFIRATEILKKYSIPYVIHLMIGLPSEGREEVMRTVELINSVKPFGVKIHSTYVMKGTRLAKMLEEGEYTALDFDRYVTTAADCIAALDPEIILHRITGDCPKGLLVAPAWNTDKNRVIDAIRCELLRRGARQGSDFCK